MDECFICGVSESEALLFDVISNEGIVKVCKNCFFQEDPPLVKINHFTEKPEKKQTVYERLSSLSGLSPEKMREKKLKSEELLKQELNLRSIVEENFKRDLKDINPPQDSGLIRNFHWIIMRARRIKHLTQKQLAEAISVPEIAIRTMEQGVVPNNPENLIKKIESCLGIKITKKQPAEPSAEQDEFKEESVLNVPEPGEADENLDGNFNENGAEINFDLLNSENLTIADLKEIKEMKAIKEGKKKRFFWSW